MDTLDALRSYILFSHQELATRFDRASEMLHPRGEPRKAAENIDTFLALMSKHLNAVDAVLLPAVRRTVPDGAHRVHDYLHTARALELALAHVKAREYGSVYDAARPWPQVWADVGRSLDSHRRHEFALGELVAVRLDAARLTALADRLHLAQAVAPSRPHPYTPHTGFPGLVARKILHAVDSFWDAAEGRMVPDPPRPPHKEPGRVAQYLLADPRFDEDHPPPGTRQPDTVEGGAD
jgi:hypothetical protein